MAHAKPTGDVDTEPSENAAVQKSTAAADFTEEISQTPRKSPLWRRILSLVWDSADGDPKDRKFVQKLDGFLFSYICLGHFIKWLDQQNYSNAFVSGMKEDLNLYGNERNFLVTYFNLGLIIGTVPSQMVQLRYVRPAIWIPACEVTWSVLVMVMASAKNVETLYALRFFVGLLEACAFPGYTALLGGWYGPTELTKRIAILEQTSSIGKMFSGYLQAGLFSSMDGKRGLAGWRWLFIMDGIISIPIAVWGFFAIPDLPHNAKAFYLTPEDKKIGVARVEKLGHGAPRKLTWQAIRGVFTNWRLWAFVAPYTFVANAGSGTEYFNLWLKANGYSVVQTNVLPTAGNAISVVFAFIVGAIVDRTGWKLPLIIVVQLLVLASNILLSVWYIPQPALLFAFYASYSVSATQPIIVSWAHELNSADPNLRQLLTATSNMFTYTFSMIFPLFLFPTYDAPHYKYGYQILAMFGVLTIGSSFVLQWQDNRENNRKRSRPDPDAETAQVTESDDGANLIRDGTVRV